MAEQLYRLTSTFPRQETYGLTAQLHRAGVSVASNIAEGQGRFSKPDFRHFLGQARGSLFEVETQLQIAQRLGYITASQLADFEELSGGVARMLNRLIQACETPPAAMTATRN